MKPETKRKIAEYTSLLKASDPRVQQFVQDNEDDKEFMVYVKAHAAIATGLIRGAGEKQ